jgi:hypothetical protein
MDILPPRRRGQLGAISVGASTTQAFSIQASSKAKSGATPVAVPQSQKGSVAKIPALSISEQVAAMRRAAAQKAAQEAKPVGQADVYGKAPVVLVQSYTPPKSTPEVTQPPRQPNENAAVPLLARQVPTTKDQVIQKVLAADAGIAIPVPPLAKPNKKSGLTKEGLLAEIKRTAGLDPWPALIEWMKLVEEEASQKVLTESIPKVTALVPDRAAASQVASILQKTVFILFAPPAPSIPSNPPIPGGGNIIGPTFEDDERELANVVYKMTSKPIPSRIASWAAMRRRGAAIADLRRVVASAVAGVPLVGISDPDYRAKLQKIMLRWLDLIDQRDQQRKKGGVQDVNATTGSGIPQPGRFASPPPPPVTKEGFEAAKKAEIIGTQADLAKQSAITKEVTVEAMQAALVKITAVLKSLSIGASMARETAKKAAQVLSEAKAKAAETLTSQTASEDAKSDAEARLRTAAEAKSLADKKAAEAVARVAEVDEEKAKLERAIAEMQKEASRAKDRAQSSERAAVEAEKQVVKAEEKALTKAAVMPQTGPGFKPPESIQGLGASPDGGMPVTSILLGLVAVGAIAYALDAKKQNLSGAPTLIENLE